MDGIGVVTEVVVGAFLQLFQLGVDGGGSGEVSNAVCLAFIVRCSIRKPSDFIQRK